jgi:hypothetical protein
MRWDAWGQRTDCTSGWYLWVKGEVYSLADVVVELLGEGSWK